jgi:tetratricopeptide (TPR) repeat protein
MSDRPQGAGIALLIAAGALSIPDLSAREGLVAAALAVALAWAALTANRSRGSAARRALFLAGTIFLAVQPFSAPVQAIERLPARALAILGLALGLWVHLNVRSVSGRMKWSFSPADLGVLGACGVVMLSSLGLLWARSDPREVIPAILAQGLAITAAVVYLYTSRWRPDAPTFRVFALLAAAVLGGAAGACGLAAVRLRTEQATALARWASATPDPAEVEQIAARAQRLWPEQLPRILAQAGRGALAHGRGREATAWIDAALAAHGPRTLAWAGALEIAEATGDPRDAEANLLNCREESAAGRLTPTTAAPVSAWLARALATDRLDAGQPADALAWIDAAVAGRERLDLALLRSEAKLALGDAAAAEQIDRDLLLRQPGAIELSLALARARWAQGDAADALAWVEDAAAAGAPEALTMPLLAALYREGGVQPEADERRAALLTGIEIVPRLGWKARHPNGNFLYTSREERRLPLLLAPGQAYRLEIEARGEPGGDALPRLRIEAGDAAAQEFEVAGGEWTVLQIPIRPRGSALTVRFTFPNDYSIAGGADRNLVLGTVRLRLDGEWAGREPV